MGKDELEPRVEFYAVKLDWSKKVGQVESERKDQILQKKAFQIIT